MCEGLQFIFSWTFAADSFLQFCGQIPLSSIRLVTILFLVILDLGSLTLKLKASQLEAFKVVKYLEEKQDSGWQGYLVFKTVLA